MSDITIKVPLIQSDTKKKHCHRRNKQSLTKLYITSGICFFFMIVEIIGGLLANSLAIMTDAAHMFSDLSGFAISIASLYIAVRPASMIMSYGYHRAEIIGAVISVALIWGLTIWLVYEAIERIQSPGIVDGWIMMITALIGLLSNIVMGVILHSSHSHSDISTGHDHAHEEDVNIKAATLHVLGDLIQSIGVIIAAAIILWNPDWSIADPICTFVFSILVTFTTFPIIKKCIGILMEGSPIDIDVDAMYMELLSVWFI
ncbi:unnamed protein product [Blepharisma stoltei]|uniref:Cation efflux protein transmembrane domain-containing protein n=1 Tax=Blepharisma stoltei TaxID=1481888 RepID=A0AAU9J289_9CILI|nr:unnamed protein product [Blepharisma stoltei]